MLTNEERNHCQRIADNLKQFESSILEEYRIYSKIHSQLMIEVFGLNLMIKLVTKFDTNAIH